MANVPDLNALKVAAINHVAFILGGLLHREREHGAQNSPALILALGELVSIQLAQEVVDEGVFLLIEEALQYIDRAEMRPYLKSLPDLKARGAATKNQELKKGISMVVAAYANSSKLSKAALAAEATLKAAKKAPNRDAAKIEALQAEIKTLNAKKLTAVSSVLLQVIIDPLEEDYKDAEDSRYRMYYLARRAFYKNPKEFRREFKAFFAANHLGAHDLTLTHPEGFSGPAPTFEREENRLRRIAGVPLRLTPNVVRALAQEEDEEEEERAPYVPLPTPPRTPVTTTTTTTKVSLIEDQGLDLDENGLEANVQLLAEKLQDILNREEDLEAFLYIEDPILNRPELYRLARVALEHGEQGHAEHSSEINEELKKSEIVKPQGDNQPLTRVELIDENVRVDGELRTAQELQESSRFVSLPKKLKLKFWASVRAEIARLEVLNGEREAEEDEFEEAPVKEEAPVPVNDESDDEDTEAVEVSAAEAAKEGVVEVEDERDEESEGESSEDSDGEVEPKVFFDPEPRVQAGQQFNGDSLEFFQHVVRLTAKAEYDSSKVLPIPEEETRRVKGQGMDDLIAAAGQTSIRKKSLQAECGLIKKVVKRLETFLRSADERETTVVRPLQRLENVEFFRDGVAVSLPYEEIFKYLKRIRDDPALTRVVADAVRRTNRYARESIISITVVSRALNARGAVHYRMVSLAELRLESVLDDYSEYRSELRHILSKFKNMEEESSLSGGDSEEEIDNSNFMDYILQVLDHSDPVPWRPKKEGTVKALADTKAAYDAAVAEQTAIERSIVRQLDVLMHNTDAYRLGEAAIEITSRQLMEAATRIRNFVKNHRRDTRMYERLVDPKQRGELLKEWDSDEFVKKLKVALNKVFRDGPNLSVPSDATWDRFIESAKSKVMTAGVVKKVHSAEEQLKLARSTTRDAQHAVEKARRKAARELYYEHQSRGDFEAAVTAFRARAAVSEGIRTLQEFRDEYQDIVAIHGSVLQFWGIPLLAGPDPDLEAYTEWFAALKEHREEALEAYHDHPTMPIELPGEPADSYRMRSMDWATRTQRLFSPTVEAELMRFLTAIAALEPDEMQLEARRVTLQSNVTGLAARRAEIEATLESRLEDLVEAWNASPMLPNQPPERFPNETKRHFAERFAAWKDATESENGMSRLVYERMRIANPSLSLPRPKGDCKSLIKQAEEKIQLVVQQQREVWVLSAGYTMQPVRFAHESNRAFGERLFMWLETILRRPVPEPESDDESNVAADVDYVPLFPEESSSEEESTPAPKNEVVNLISSDEEESSSSDEDEAENAATGEEGEGEAEEGGAGEEEGGDKEDTGEEEEDAEDEEEEEEEEEEDEGDDAEASTGEEEASDDDVIEISSDEEVIKTPSKPTNLKRKKESPDESGPDKKGHREYKSPPKE